MDYEQKLLHEYFPDDDDFAAASARVKNGEPLAYIIGEWGFYGEMYTVTPAVLIPRPDTETLVEQAIRLMPDSGRMLDLCTGSGCVGISSLCHTNLTSADLLDISPDALDVARVNAERNGVSARLTFIQGDVRTYTPAQHYDIITANPPYIRTNVIDTLSEQVRREPRIALDGGVDGLEFYRVLLERYIAHCSYLVFEIGYDQRYDISCLCVAYSKNVEFFKDLGGNFRVAVVQK